MKGLPNSSKLVGKSDIHLDPRLKKNSITFIYADPPGFSGQRNAVDIIINGLNPDKWVCYRIPTPTIDRTKSESRLSRLKYIFVFFRPWIQAIYARFICDNLCYLTFGQTSSGLIRDGVPFLLFCLFRKRKQSVISFHGSNFMRWEINSLNARILRFICSFARKITVLGENQKARLIQMGVSSSTILVLPNTTDIQPLEAALVEKKHNVADGQLKILFLSSLIRSKGYMIFLESLERLEISNGVKISVILCGNLLISDYDDFSSVQEAKSFLAGKKDLINARANFNIEWINGAFGPEKEKLFREAHIFVLPTSYPVEAQPLVLLEAMASGCAIVTSRVGEITTILSDRSAILLEDPCVENVAQSIETLINFPGMRTSYASVANKSFRNTFSLSPHIRTWEDLFSNLLS